MINWDLVNYNQLKATILVYAKSLQDQEIADRLRGLVAKVDRESGYGQITEAS